MDYRIELRDRAFNMLEVLEDEASNINWEYIRIGGCGAFSFKLARKYDDQGVISGDYDIRIYKRTGTGTYSLWYAGLIEERIPILDEEEKIEIRGYGYISQLKNVVVNTTYTDKEISVIVKDILDNYITPNTDITYDAGDLEDTGFTCDSLTFKTNALQAMQTLADIAGIREWGVGSDRKFFFKARSDTINFHFPVGDKIKLYHNIDNFRNIKNKLYLEGGEVGGNKYTRTKSDAASILKYGTKEEIIQNASIVTNTVADQYLDALLAEKSELERKAKIELIGYTNRIETSVPLGRLVVMTPGIRYGEDYYGNFLYQGHIKYQINRINYKINDKDGSLGITLDVGVARPSIAENIGKLLYEIEQLRMARV